MVRTRRCNSEASVNDIAEAIEQFVDMRGSRDLYKMVLQPLETEQTTRTAPQVLVTVTLYCPSILHRMCALRCDCYIFAFLYILAHVCVARAFVAVLPCGVLYDSIAKPTRG